MPTNVTLLEIGVEPDPEAADKVLTTIIYKDPVTGLIKTRTAASPHKPSDYQDAIDEIETDNDITFTNL